jgi:2-oxoglutarate ferredoxin oxidoreductase subunit beta
VSSVPESAPVAVRDFAGGRRPTWCPGCGDFGILTALKKAFADLGVAPHQVMLVSGIGCGSKLPDYLHANGFMTIHGRPLPVATGVKLANPRLHVVVVDGDGDAYGIGGNHFLHAARRNPDITHIVENNQIYALTKGQYSPTSDAGFVTTTSPEGAIERPVLPTALAFAAGAGFIARGFAGQPRELAELFAAALRHRGYALVDVLQPCVTFNKVNTYRWYEERIARAEDEAGYDPADPGQAWERVRLWGDRIPTGVLWRTQAPTYEERVPALAAGPVAGRPLDLDRAVFARLKEEFM